MSYKKSYEKYTIEVVPVGEKFDVQFTIKDALPRTISIEVCETEDHATKGAEKFPDFYELALKHGYTINNVNFSHPDGREVHLSNAMDLDRTDSSFEELLIKGEKSHPFL